VLLRTLEEFVAEYGPEATGTLQNTFAVVSRHGYIPEAGKILIAELTRPVCVHHTPASVPSAAPTPIRAQQARKDLKVLAER